MLVASVLAVVLPLSGCVSPPKVDLHSTSVPTKEDVGEALQPFYSQELAWTKCGAQVQCATARAPMDWSNPGSASIDLALIRTIATGDRLGSLLVNPGGPGASGVDFIKDSLNFAVDATLKDRYDIVGFDPRGVNRSSAVSCYANPAELDRFLYGIPSAPYGTPEYVAEINAQFAAFGQSCLNHTGQLLGFVDTVSAARDLDLLRAILGDKKLNYLGYSYGTLLGATYAELYPKHTGHLVLDGAIDPETSDFDVVKTQAIGFENALQAYVKDCLSRSSCPFTGTVKSAMNAIGQLMTRVGQAPIPASDGRMLGTSSLFYAIILPLYSEDTWKYLSELFTSVLRGQADYAFQLADAYNDRKADGTYSTNSTEAFLAINCLDYTPDNSFQTLKAQAAILAEVAPVMGKAMSFSPTCAGWPFAATRDHTKITAEGSAPILVIGTTNDPATPYVWAQNLSRQLANGHLVTYRGEGHTAYNKSNSCVNSTVDDFFTSGTVPGKDPRC